MKQTRAKSGRRTRPDNSSEPVADNPPQQPEIQPEPVVPVIPSDLSPLDYALRIMRDETQPVALRAGMAKVALPYLHPRGADLGADLGADSGADETPKPLTDLELARRIAFILTNAGKELNPVEKPANADPEGGVGAKTS